MKENETRQKYIWDPHHVLAQKEADETWWPPSQWSYFSKMRLGGIELYRRIKGLPQDVEVDASHPKILEIVNDALRAGSYTDTHGTRHFVNARELLSLGAEVFYRRFNDHKKKQ